MLGKGSGFVDSGIVESGNILPSWHGLEWSAF